MSDKNIEMAVKIARLTAERGGAAYYTGGYVRDRLLRRESKDVDLEIHGLYPRQLEEVLDALGERISMGESFGIYALKGYSLDIALPRREGYGAAGRRGTEDDVDPFVGTRSAAMRRDFTMNAMMENVLTGEITDPFDGRGDIKKGIIRHVSDDSFGEDPLRVLRAAQFAARFGYAVAEETEALCRGLDISDLPRERVLGEVEKALLKAEKPSLFFRELRRMDQLDAWFPELKNTIGVGQDPKHHAEGDVWTHTLMVTDAAARFRDRARRPLGFMLSAVTHDLGKSICTETVNGALHAYRHETLGLPLIGSFLRRLTNERALIDYVLNLSEYHMKPNRLAEDRASVRATNRMFDRSVDPEALLWLAAADGVGKIPPVPPEVHGEFLFGRLALYRETMSRPYVAGRDLIAAGLRPSERFSEYLSFAHKLRLAGVSKENALRQTLALAAKNGDRADTAPEENSAPRERDNDGPI